MSQEKINRFTSKIQKTAEQAEKHHFLNALCWLHDAQGMLLEAHNDVLKDKLEGWGRDPNKEITLDDPITLDETAKAQGFGGESELHQMVTSVDLADRATFGAFAFWQLRDGSKEGLQFILDGKHKRR